MIRELLRVGRFGEVFCDVNLRPNSYDAESTRICMENATVLKLSREEEPLLRQMGLYQSESNEPKALLYAIAEAYRNLHTVLLTDGKDGAYAYLRRENAILHEPAYDAGPVVSTVGAGDSFGASWLVSYLLGDSPATSLRKAAQRSGHVVARREAIPSDLLAK